MLIQLTAQRGDQIAAMIVDRATATEVMVARRDFQQAFLRDVPAASHILQKRYNVFLLFRPSKPDDRSASYIFQTGPAPIR